mmetsp:Transcript_57617/g.134155  ORF Transcript_57617/g.134155 Transcript_57617/m.134155 type:complete len:235 (+) Transcript_57617:682-1386(+)
MGALRPVAQGEEQLPHAHVAGVAFHDRKRDQHDEVHWQDGEDRPSDALVRPVPAFDVWRYGHDKVGFGAVLGFAPVLTKVRHAADGLRTHLEHGRDEDRGHQPHHGVQGPPQDLQHPLEQVHLARRATPPLGSVRAVGLHQVDPIIEQLRRTSERHKHEGGDHAEHGIQHGQEDVFPGNPQNEIKLPPHDLPCEVCGGFDLIPPLDRGAKGKGGNLEKGHNLQDHREEYLQRPQ